MPMSPCEAPKDYIEYFSFERMTSQILQHSGARIVLLRNNHKLIKSRRIVEVWTVARLTRTKCVTRGENTSLRGKYHIITDQLQQTLCFR